MEPAKISFDITSGDNWDRIYKFLGAQIIVGIIIIVMVFIIVYVYINIIFANEESTYNFYKYLGVLVITFLTLLIPGQILAISLYEKWRGCHVKK